MEGKSMAREGKGDLIVRKDESFEWDAFSFVQRLL
jgi:hypothetical protein